jgi:hypothetical protein
VSTRYENMQPKDWQCVKLLSSWEFHVGSIQSILKVNLNMHHIAAIFSSSTSCSALSVREFLASYSPDLLQCDKVLWMMVQLLVSLYKVSRTVMIWM